jgi:hypothetical protein
MVFIRNENETKSGSDQCCGGFTKMSMMTWTNIERRIHKTLARYKVNFHFRQSSGFIYFS